MSSFNVGSPDILTVGGRFFDFLDPKPEQIDIDDIAHGLAMTCRFAGHCTSFYSVAQHSLEVARRVSPEHRLAALLHDAAEAYLCDMPRPIKQRLPDYQALEDTVQRAILSRFGLPPSIPTEVKHADARMLATEGRDLCPPQWEYWKLDVDPYEERLEPVCSVIADRARFLGLYYELVGYPDAT